MPISTHCGSAEPGAFIIPNPAQPADRLRLTPELEAVNATRPGDISQKATSGQELPSSTSLRACYLRWSQYRGNRARSPIWTVPSLFQIWNWHLLIGNHETCYAGLNEQVNYGSRMMGNSVLDDSIDALPEFCSVITILDNL